MAENKTIEATLQVNTGSSNANIKEVNKNLKDVKTSLNETGSAAKTTGKEIGGAGDQFGKIKNSLNALPGPLGQANAGANTLSSSFKALLANPVALVIVAIVGALSLLYKAFTSTNEGADKTEQIFAGLSASLEVVYNRIAKVANSILLILQGDFAAAAAEGREAFKGIGDEIVAEFGKAKKGTEIMQEVEDKTRDLSKSRALLNRDLAATKEIITDETASLQDKKKAIIAVGESEAQQTAAELDNAKKKLDAIKLIQGSRDLSDEDLNERVAAENEITALEEKSATDRRTINKQSRTLERQARAQDKIERAAAIEQQKAERQSLLEYTNKLLQLQQENELLAIKDNHAKELQALQNKIDNEKRQTQQAFLDRKITKEQQNKINEGLDIQFNLQKEVIDEKRKKEDKDKEESFQRDLAEVKNRIRLAGITDSRQIERVQMDIEYEKDLKAAMLRYAGDQVKLNEYKATIDEELKTKKAVLDEKNRKEDEKKKLDDQLKKSSDIIDDPTTSFKAKQAALDVEVAANEKAFKDKTITEQQYNENVEKFAKARKELNKAEMEGKLSSLTKYGNALGSLSEIVGKQTVAGKAFAVAQATIATIQSAVNSYNSLSAIPIVGPILGGIAAAAAVAAGIRNVKKIVAVQIPGGGGSGASMPDISVPSAPAAPIAPKATSTNLSQNSIDAIKTSGNDATKGRVYVLEQDNRAAADRAARLEGASVLGGRGSLN